MKRVLVIVVLIAAIAGVAWFLRPDLVEPVVSNTTRAPAAPSPAQPQREASTIRAAATPAATTASPAEQGAVRAEAEQHVARLSQPEPAPVSAERADHFVSGEQVVNLLPSVAIERTTVQALRADPKLTAQTPITVVREVEQVERVSPERLIAQSAGDLDTQVRQVMPDDSVRTTTIREMLEQARAKPNAPMLILKQVQHYEQTTPAELVQELESQPQKPIKVVRGAHGIELARLKDLVRTQVAISDDSLFYVRTVRDTDDQGIWGIVHDGIIGNFARGMAIRRGEAVNTYRVDIPRDADEREGNASSFLGRLIHDKVGQSVVYNLRENRMGRNPDRIFPGQEIVIVNFEVDELIEIYEYFVAERG